MIIGGIISTPECRGNMKNPIWYDIYETISEINVLPGDWNYKKAEDWKTKNEEALYKIRQNVLIQFLSTL